MVGTPTTTCNNNCNNNVMVVVMMMVMVHVVGVGAGQRENSSEALLKFKSGLANADPGLENWVSTTAPCSGNSGNWRGVLCFNGYVWGLQLENMSLAGQIDVNSLAPLRFLRTLSFMNNNFQGTMPDWRKLGALKSLYLSNNQFSGEIPQDAFRGMTSLKKVYLANNKFIGPIPASLESPKLIELRLDNNQFTGSIPPISSDNLKVFNVSNNHLEGPIPAPLLKMDPTSFAGNKDLCGKPLEASCDPPIPPPDLEPSLFPPPPPAADDSDIAPPPPPPPHQSSISPSIIAIIILSILLSLLLIILLLLLCRRRRTQHKGTAQLSPPTSYAQKNGAAAAAATVVSTRGGGDMISGKAPPPPQQQQQAGKLSFVRDDRQKFDLQDLMRASAEVLGSGNFGASYKAVLVDGEALVVKRFKQMNNIAREDFHEHMRRIGRLKHTNLLPLVAYLYRKEEKLLVFDFVSNGSLASHLHGKGKAGGLSWENRLKIIKGVSKGLGYLNAELPSLSVAHGHLKSSNVLLDDNFNPVLMDYALGPVVNPNQVHQVLVAYKCPEYALTGRTSKKSDVWCLGILILEILTAKLLSQQQYGTKWIDEEPPTLDKDMEISSESCRAQMEKLLQIGIGCCHEDLDKRLDLEDAIKMIEQVQQH